MASRFCIKKTVKTVSYLRVSGKAQVDGGGFARQRAVVKAYAAKVGLQLVDEFQDKGVSGTRPLGERPGLSALFSRILSNGIRVVLVEKADRLARDLIEGELILRQFRSADVRVIAAESGTDLTEGDDKNPTATLIRQVLGAVAEFEKSALVGKLRAARDRVRRERGRCEGPVPFGQMPGEASALERLLELFRKPRGQPRRSLSMIAKVLNDEGVPTRRGGPWRRSTVQAILRRHGKT